MSKSGHAVNGLCWLKHCSNYLVAVNPAQLDLSATMRLKIEVGGAFGLDLDMRKRLTKTGNKLALVLDKCLLDRLGISADTPLEVSTDGHVIVISPVLRRPLKAALKHVVQGAHRRYGGVFSRLARS